MRIRNFRWSRDVAIPAAFILVSIWGIVGGSAQVAFLAGALFIVQSLVVLSRVERARPDGSYKGLLSEELYKPAGARVIIFGGVVGGTVVSVTLLLSGLPLYLAIPAGAGTAIAWGPVWVLLIRRRG